MSAGGEAENKNARIRIAEAGNRFSPIFVLAVGASFFSRYEFAVRDEAGTTRAGNNFTIELNEPVWVAGHRCDCTGGGARIYVKSALDSNGGYHTQAVL